MEGEFSFLHFYLIYLSLSASGLQLYIASDGTTSLSGRDVKSRLASGAFKQVVMENPR